MGRSAQAGGEAEAEREAAVIIWLILATLAGATVPRIFPKRRGMATAVVMFVPPLLLSLYFISTASGDPWLSFGLLILILTWVVPAGITALATTVALRRRDKRDQ